jgi:SNF2 family DNA or RNA helicase
VLSLWEHQQRMADFAASRSRVIFDCGMGGGKTGTAAHVVSERWGAKLVLIIAPKKVVESHSPWGKDFELGRFTDRKWEVVRLHKGSIPQRLAALKRHGKEWRDGGEAHGLVFVVNYEATLNEKLYAALKAAPWDAVILDEAHRIKGHKAKVSKRVAAITQPIPRVLGLTGTLMPHSPMDLFGSMRSVDGSVFGSSFVRFRNRYGVMGGFQGKVVVGFQNMDEMMERCREHIIRVTEADMELELHGTVDEEVELEMCPKAARAYRELSETMVAEVDGGLITASNALTKILRLMQLTGGTQVVDVIDDLGEVVDRVKSQIDTSKEDYIKEMCSDTDDQIVVFCLFHSDLDAVSRAAEAAGKSCMEVSGRVNDLDKWVAGEAQVLAVQIGAGAEGIDLTNAHLAVFYSTGHSLGKYLQARKRLDRPGQKRTVLYKHLIVKDSIDAVIARALARKEEVVNSVLDLLREAVSCGPWSNSV